LNRENGILKLKKYNNNYLNIMPIITDHYQYDKIIHLNAIDELINEGMLLSITFQHQINFTSISQVRKYIKDKGSTPGKDDNPFDLITVMMEALFGHYSTSLLDHVELTTMWSKLFVNSVERLYLQNILIVPESKRSTENNFEPYIQQVKIHANEMANAETEPYSDERKLLKQEYLGRVMDKYRGKTELAILMSKFAFLIASRFYTPPVHKTPHHVKKYATLRMNLISAWCDMVGTEVLKNVNPELSFTFVEPKFVAFKVFSPDSQYDIKKLQKRKRKFDTWFERERTLALRRATETGDALYRAGIDFQWSITRAFGDQLHDALVPRAQAITNKELEEDSNCLINDLWCDSTTGEDYDYENDKGFSKEDLDAFKVKQKQFLSLFSPPTDTDKRLIEASELGYDDYLARQFANENVQLQPSVFEDVDEETSDEESDGDYIMDDGGVYLDEYNNHMNTKADGADIKRESYRNNLRVTDIPISTRLSMKK
jgi:hypothetical protein